MTEAGLARVTACAQKAIHGPSAIRKAVPNGQPPLRVALPDEKMNHTSVSSTTRRKQKWHCRQLSPTTSAGGTYPGTRADSSVRSRRLSSLRYGRYGCDYSLPAGQRISRYSTWQSIANLGAAISFDCGCRLLPVMAGRNAERQSCSRRHLSQSSSSSLSRPDRRSSDGFRGLLWPQATTFSQVGFAGRCTCRRGSTPAS